MGLISKVMRYKRQHGVKALINRIIFQKQPNSISATLDSHKILDGSIHKIYEEKFSQLSALNVYTVPNVSKKRINLITDSVNQGSLFGGVATAIIFSALLANEKNVEIRIITRTEKAEEFRIRELLNLLGFNCKTKISFLFAHFLDKKSIDVSDHDFFITTSWWTTEVALKSVKHDKILYILQEDERMFYAYGDEHLLCNEVLSNQKIRYIINTQLLYDHLISTGLTHLKNTSIYFEPSFDKQYFFWQERAAAPKRKLLFYARPNNPRNLFYRGMLVLEKAILMGIIDLSEWDIYFVGNHLNNKIKFSNGYFPKIVANLDYLKYAEFIRSVDLGLSLMYTPHPSYPPLDLAASGAIVVTNQTANKSNLLKYSENILCVGSGVESLLEGVKNGIALALDTTKRKAQYDKNNISTDWKKSFNHIIQSVEL